MGGTARLAGWIGLGWAVASALPALALSDSATGFGVAPPAPFVAETAPPASHDLAFGVNAPDGTPARAGTSPYLCKVGFKKSGLNSTLGQAEINKRVAGEQWREVSRKVLDRMFTITAVEPLPLGEAVGVEYQVTPKFGPGAENVRSYIALIETPKGRIMTSCATTATDWPAALPQFRAIQATISLPK